MLGGWAVGDTVYANNSTLPNRGHSSKGLCRNDLFPRSAGQKSTSIDELHISGHSTSYFAQENDIEELHFPKKRNNSLWQHHLYPERQQPLHFGSAWALWLSRSLVSCFCSIQRFVRIRTRYLYKARQRSPLLSGFWRTCWQLGGSSSSR